MNIRLGEIAKVVGGRLKGNPEGVIKTIFIDSRKHFATEDSLFIAISGERNDGHDYIKDLLQAGIGSFIVERIPENVKDTNSSFIIVENSIDALQDIAAWYRGNFDYPVLGITGSNGKTIVKEWIYQAVGEEIHIIRSPQSYNSQVGVPLSLFLLEDSYNMAIIEAGISKPGEMMKLQKMIRPGYGIMTNLGEAHQENFSSLREKVIEKLRLFIESDKIIYCADYSLVHKEAQIIFPDYKLISWGMSSDFDYYVTREISVDGSNIRFEGKVSAIINTPFVDLASIENCSHVIVFLFEQGYTPAFVQKAVLSLEPVSMRMEILKGSNQCTIINDSYNSDLVSVSNALDYLELQVQHDKKTLIISDIFQSGINNNDLYKKLAGMISKRTIHKVIAVGEKISANRRYFDKNTVFYPDTDSFLKDLPSCHFFDEAILLKGARKFEFERISSYLQESAHRTVLEIDLNALLENYRYYRSLLKPEVKVMAMVKAFSYGSGGYEIANLLEYQNVEYLAVAYADEGVSLRKNGIKTPIMVMSPEKNDFPLLIQYNLEPEIYSLRILGEFGNYLTRNAVGYYPVHLKIDTGMHRLGFSKDEADEILEKINKSNMKVVSVFSHLAASDEEEHDDFTHDQILRFNKFCISFKEKLGYGFIRHILNTSGIERFPDAQFDMVRPGIGLYGVSAFASDNIREVSTFKTRVSQIKELKDGESVGYGRKGKVRKYRKIATIPVGYADGIPRSIGNGIGKFMINHHLAPVIGSVCMDMTMLDITGIDVSEGDEVIIFGKEHPVRNMAGYANTIAYEILTGISRRVKRIYYQE